MRKIYFSLICLLSLTLLSNAFAQREEEESHYPTYLRLGINFGGAWQCSDVRAVPGAGLGFTAEVPIIQKPWSPIAISLRGRYLFTRTYGQDWERSTGIANNNAINGVNNPAIDYTSQGYVYANHRTTANEWDLELMLIHNRLKQRKILLYLFGGVGANGYSVDMNQSGAFGAIYDYNTMVTATDKQEVLNQIRSGRWPGYDIPADNVRRPHWVFAPSVGIGWGWMLGRHSSIGFEFKTTFPFTDKFDGQEWENDNTLTARNDIYHYGGFFFRLGFGKRPRSSGGVSGGPTRPVKPTPVPTGQRPSISMINPGGGHMDATPDCRSEIRARIRYTPENGISLYHNGRLVPSSRWSYNASNQIFRAVVDLFAGMNQFELKARNRYGTEIRKFTIRCPRPQNTGGGGVVVNPPPPPPGQGPQIICVYPPSDPYITTTVDCSSEIVADIINVRSKSDITFKHNGYVVSPRYYDYNPRTRRFIAYVNLLAGINVFEIIARNGKYIDRRVIQIECPSQIVPPPRVLITQPGTNPYTSNECTQRLVAQIDNVRDGSQVTVFQDQRKVSPREYAFSPRTGILQMDVRLQPGQASIIRITASNATGQSTQTQTLSCAQQTPPPTITLSPTSEECNQRIEATLTNIDQKNQIQVLLNGNVVSPSKYVFSSNNGRFQMMVNLTPGVTYTYTLIATNESGSTQKVFRVKCGRNVVTTRMITICHQPPGARQSQTMTIKESDWPQHQAHGDVRGACPPAAPVEITICHVPPENPNNVQTIKIPESQWPQHLAHGDIRGACSGRQITICHKDEKSKGGFTTITIPEEAWAHHQAHGDTRGECPVNSITICHVPPSNPNNVQTITIPESDWPSHQAHGDVQGPCSGRTMAICHIKPGTIDNFSQMLIPIEAWPFHQAHGDSRGDCPQAPTPQKIKICHIPPNNPDQPQTLEIPERDWASHQTHGDTRGECNMTPITICHKATGRGGERTTMTIPTASWPHHQAHGDTRGECPKTTTRNITICHFPPNRPDEPQTLTIPLKDWPSHQAHGDTQGECNMTPITICHKDGSRNGNTNLTIPMAAWPRHQAHGDARGPCPEPNKITICHYPPGDRENPQTLQVLESTWATHAAHGDTRGACDMSTMQICHKVNARTGETQTLTIPKAAWPIHQAHGDQSGPCAAPEITICHFPIGRPNEPQTITIKESDWAIHQAHGDSRGACDMTPIEICHKGTTRGASEQNMTIPRAAWPAHQAHGDKLGRCADPKITICHYPPNDPENPQTIAIDEGDWRSHKGHGDTQGPCDMSLMTICHQTGVKGGFETIQIPRATWAFHQRHGDQEGECSRRVITICHFPPGDPDHPRTMHIWNTDWPAHAAHGDTRGGECDLTPMVICHKEQNTMSGKKVKLTIPTASWPFHQKHGDSQGDCPVEEILVCHVNTEDPSQTQTISIGVNEWPAHQAHGDVRGPCSPTKITICHKPPGNPNNQRTLRISQSAWKAHQAHGDTRGDCPRPKIAICHIPPGDMPRPQNLSIPDNEWQAHAQHGDKRGACDMRLITICHQGRQIRVQEATWARHQSHGDTRGECPVATIKICHIPPGSIGAPKNMNIPETQWRTHAAHFDHKGNCNMVKMTICYQNRSIQIPKSSLRAYQAKGAKAGPCPPPKKPGSTLR